jgi:hypothetical protein
MEPKHLGLCFKYVDYLRIECSFELQQQTQVITDAHAIIHPVSAFTQKYSPLREHLHALRTTKFIYAIHRTID